MLFHIIAIGIIALAAIGLPITWLLLSRRRYGKPCSVNEQRRALTFARDNWKELVSPKFGVITEWRLLLALKRMQNNATAVRNLQVLLQLMPSMGHSLDSYEVTGMISNGIWIMPTAYTQHIYGVSQGDLERREEMLKGVS